MFVRLVPHAARVAKNVMLCYVMGCLYYSEKGVLGDDSYVMLCLCLQLRAATGAA